MIYIGFLGFHIIRGNGSATRRRPWGGIKGGCFAMYKNAIFCNCPSSTYRGWALASHTRPVGLPRRFAAVRTWILRLTPHRRPLGGLAVGMNCWRRPFRRLLGFGVSSGQKRLHHKRKSVIASSGGLQGGPVGGSWVCFGTPRARGKGESDGKARGGGGEGRKGGGGRGSRKS